MAGSRQPPASGLQASSVLLGIAAGLLAVVWLTEVAGDPTDGVAFYTFAFAAAILVGIALVIAAARRRDLFGELGLPAAIVVLVSALLPDLFGFAAGGIGLVLITAAVAGREQRLLPGVVLLALGVLGIGLGIDITDAAYVVFLPLLAAGSAFLAVALRRV